MRSGDGGFGFLGCAFTPAFSLGAMGFGGFGGSGVGVGIGAGCRGVLSPDCSVFGGVILCVLMVFIGTCCPVLDNFFFANLLVILVDFDWLTLFMNPLAWYLSKYSFSIIF